MCVMRFQAVTSRLRVDIKVSLIVCERIFIINDLVIR